MIEDWTDRIEKAVKQELMQVEHLDASHDFGHSQRVSAVACQFAIKENADLLVVFTAGMLHDIVSLPKTDPNAKKSSYYAAERAREILLEMGFPDGLIPDVCHAVHAHSFSAKVEPKTIEAKCLQDADRMEALGAFGLMRVFYCSGMYGSQLMDEADPAGENRELNDKEFALDHFALKLLTLHSTMKTNAGSAMAKSLSDWLEEFCHEIIEDFQAGNLSSGRFKIAHTFREAGKRRDSLFHPDDPFAESGRPLSPNEYALDGVLQDNDPYIKKFIDQLTWELQREWLAYCRTKY